CRQANQRIDVLPLEFFPCPLSCTEMWAATSSEERAGARVQTGLRGSESIIDPELADGDSLPDVHPRDLDGSTSKRSSQSYRARTKVEVIIFSLGRPIAPERPLDAATDGPARLASSGRNGATCPTWVVHVAAGGAAWR